MKKLSLIMILTLNLNAIAEVNCDKTLGLCDRYVKTLERERDAVKVLLEEQNEKLAKATEASPSLPWYTYVLTGMAAGFILKGVVK